MKYIQPGAWVLALWLFLGAGVLAQTAKFGDEIYQPIRGQMGRDVMWMPTAQDHVMKLLNAAKVSATDRVYDLGAGDGIIPIVAATQFGAKSVGIEYNLKLVELARRNAQRAGVGDKVNFVQGDIFVEDFSSATVVTLYLLPELNFQLRPTLLKMKPGTRVVSNEFDMSDWQPDLSIQTGRSKGYLWIVPAEVAGTWSLQGLAGMATATLDLSQRFQKIGGYITLDQQQHTLLGAELSGDRLSVHFVDGKQVTHSLKAKVNGSLLEGELQAGDMNASTNQSIKGRLR